MRNKNVNISPIDQNNSKSVLEKREKLPLKDDNKNNISNQNKPKNNNEIKKDLNKNQTPESSNFWDKTKNFFKDIWGNKLKRYVALGIILAIVVIVVVVAVVVSVTKSESESEPEPHYECSDPEYETPDCNGVCDNPYNIQVYSDCKLKQKLINECKYREDSDLTNFVLDAIKRHNVLRACHNAQPLMFNCEILKISQDYANKIPSGHSGTRFHGEWMGENLFWSGGMTLTGDFPVNRWYAEISDYNFETGQPDSGKTTGHFTQVVWKASRELGIGYYCKERQCCVVGNYYPGGNFNNNYLSQVQNKQ